MEYKADLTVCNIECFPGLLPNTSNDNRESLTESLFPNELEPTSAINLANCSSPMEPTSRKGKKNKTAKPLAPARDPILSSVPNLPDPEPEKIASTVSSNLDIGGSMLEENSVLAVSEKSPSTSLRCQYCNKVFTSEFKLQYHIFHHTGEKPFRCRYCDLTFKAISERLRHEREEHTSKPLSCPWCDRKFGCKSAVWTHKKFSCTMKPKSTELNSEDQANISKLQCRYCEKLFRVKQNLTVHERTHTGEKPFVCKFCPVAFIKKDLLLIHERLHTGETPFHCRFCDKEFRSKTACQGHESTHAQPTFECDVCGKKFKRKNKLAEHSYVHTNMNFQCQCCGKIFTSPVKLKEHENLCLVETGAILTSVPVNSLNPGSSHSRVEPESNIYRTNLCDSSMDPRLCETLPPKPLLKSASRHVCRICNQEFTSANKLKRHICVHTGQNPKSFDCRHCDSSFKSSYLRLQHEKTEHTDLPLQCPWCQKEFGWKTSLGSHKKNCILKPTSEVTLSGDDLFPSPNFVPEGLLNEALSPQPVPRKNKRKLHTPSRVIATALLQS